MKNRIVIYSLTLLIVLILLSLTWYADWFMQSFDFAPVTASKPHSPAFSIGSTSPVSSYAFLFDEERELNTGNIVGYFAGGAFGWYVPDWMVQNWTIKDSALDEGMVIVPKLRRNDNDFSNIIFTIQPSTETFNAATLYENNVKSLVPASLVINEVVLNKHTEGGLMITMETDTRIYHIQELVNGRAADTYYIDGKGKTLIITFDAKEEVFSQFAPHIRNMVEGIGELKTPQG